MTSKRNKEMILHLRTVPKQIGGVMGKRDNVCIKCGVVLGPKTDMTTDEDFYNSLNSDNPPYPGVVPCTKD